MSDKLNQFPKFPVEGSNFTCSFETYKDAEDLQNIINKYVEQFNVFSEEPKHNVEYVGDLKNYIYSLNISKDIKDSIDNYLSIKTYMTIGQMIVRRFLMLKNRDNYYSSKESETIIFVDALFKELINNNNVESLNIKLESFDNMSLLDLIFELQLFNDSFVLDEQQIINCLQILDKINIQSLSYEYMLYDNLPFYKKILNLIMKDEYFNIIINKPTLFISIIGTVQKCKFPPKYIIKMFNRLQYYDLDYNIFKWSHIVSNLNNVASNKNPETKQHYLNDIEYVLKHDEYVKKFNIKDNENLAKWLDL